MAPRKRNSNKTASARGGKKNVVVAETAPLRASKVKPIMKQALQDRNDNLEDEVIRLKGA
jgi:hypothetical protein